jgi:energy-coupling factor transporter ATP-binding protein EcfA2
MRIKKLHIRNFKSLVDFELNDLRPFCAFVGPNASGKSNIFEALEFTNYLIRYQQEAPGFFGGISNIFSYSPSYVGLRPNDPESEMINWPDIISFNYDFKDGIRIPVLGNIIKDQKNLNQFVALSSSGPAGFLSLFDIRDLKKREEFVAKWMSDGKNYDKDYEQFVDNFSRLFIGNTRLNRTPAVNSKLSPDAGNLGQIIGPIFEQKEKRDEFLDWLRILIPEFRDIEVRKSNININYDFFIYEKGIKKPFPRTLISDGTYNILSLMAAVYQSNQPQFLCIEEPENGLHPQAIELLVDFFREKCEEEGHHIWLNTHSQTLVRSLEIDEIILVNKIDGATKAKQLTKEDEVNIKTDEAWLSNALGGGVLWSK